MMERIKINLNSTDKIKKFINVARGFESDIDIMNDRCVIDGKSILGLFDLDLSKDAYVRIISDDENEINRFRKEMEEFQ